MILNTEKTGKITDEVKYIDYFGNKIGPSKANWGTKESITIINADYAGLYLPKTMESYVDKIQGAIIAPTAIPDSEFTKQIICNMDQNSIGETYKEARNNYYWETKRPSGLSLMSWELYGIPTNIIEGKKPNNCGGQNYDSQIY